MAVESKPGCIIGCPEAIDGVFLLRTRPNYGNLESNDYQFADIITSIIVYLSGLTGLVIVLVNKHVFKNKAKKEELALQAANADTPVSSQEITENIIPDNANEKGGKE